MPLAQTRTRLRRPDVHVSMLICIGLLFVTSLAAASTYEIAVPAAVDPAAADPWRDLPRLADPTGPALPYHDLSVLLPPGEELVAVDVRPHDPVASPAPRDIPVARPPLSDAGLAAGSRSVTGGDTSWPGVWGEALGTSTWHGFAVAGVRVYPRRLLRNDPEGDWTGMEESSGFTVTITTRPTTRETARPQRSRPGEWERWTATIADRVINPGALARYADPTRPIMPAEKGFTPTDLPSMTGAGVDLLIITDDELSGSFQNLADWRTSLGVPTVVRTLSWLDANVLPEADLQTTLRVFLRDAYERWGVRWVLLGGDVEIIPTRMIFNGYYPVGEGSDIPVDLYYGALDGSWNADGDEIMGEPYVSIWDPGDDVDLTPELNVGRASVTTVEEADLFVSKILAYEHGNVGPHCGRALFMSEVLIPGAYVPGGEITDDGATYSEAIIDDILFDETYTHDRYYETWDQWPGTQAESRTSVLAAMNSGQYSLVNHIGHGFFYTMSVGDGTLDVKDAMELSNGTNYFLLNNLNCASAAFDYNSIMERFVTNPDGGAVAAVGSSRAAFPVTAGAYQYEFFTALFDDDAPTLGDAVTAMRLPFDALTIERTVERWTHMALVLVGDPAMPVWTTAPDTLDVTLPSSLALGGADVAVTVQRQGLPLADARVCLWKDGDDYVVGTTDAAGQVLLPFTAKGAGPVAVGVSHPECRPHVDTLNAVQSGTPYLRLDELTVVDDGSLGSVGNGDGQLDAGETVALISRWANTGAGATTLPGTVTLSSSDALATVLQGAALCPPTGPGATSDADAPFLVHLDPAFADRSELRFDLVADADGLTCPDLWEGEVLAPVIEPSIITWGDYPSGNGNGLIEPGEQIAFSLSLVNTGWGKAEGLSGWIETGTPQVTVHAGNGSWPDLDRYAETDQLDQFLLEMAVIDEDVEAILHLTDARGHEWIHTISLTVPAQTTISTIEAPAGGEVLLTWAPNTEPDLYGYHVWRAPLPAGPFTRLTVRPLPDVTFIRDTGLEPLSTYYYRVAAVDSSRLLGRYSSILSVSTIPREQSGFPLPMGAETSSHMAVVDLGLDGVLDIVTASDAIYVWDASGNELRDGDADPQTLGPFAGAGGQWSPAGIALGNLTDHPGPEIVASNRNDKSIYVFEADGDVAPGWPQPMSNWNWATPAVGDLDGDGDLEVVVNNIQGRTYAWHHDGTEVFDGDANPGTHGVFHVRSDEWYSYCSPALVDLDGDGAAEIVMGSKSAAGVSDHLYAIRHDGTSPPGFPVDLTAYGDLYGSLAVGDLEPDGVIDIVFVTENDKLHVVNQFGSHRAGFPIAFVSDNPQAGSTAPTPALADMDGDGRLDIVAVSVDDVLTSLIHVIDPDGVELSGWPKPANGASESSPIVGDLSGDGLPDVVFGIGGSDLNQPNLLHVYLNDGETMPGFPLELDGPVRATPTLCDLNGDGDVDLVYAGWDLAVHVWDLPAAWDRTAMPWPTFQGNPRRDGTLPTGWETGVPEEPVDLPEALTLLGNHPNPFNPATRIAFDLPEGAAGRIALEIIDVRGRHVRTLLDGILAPGRHVVTWNGTDDRGRQMSSGVYLYRLRTPAGDRLGRMVLVR